MNKDEDGKDCAIREVSFKLQQMLVYVIVYKMKIEMKLLSFPINFF